MLAWADDQALEATRSTSEAHFWSRSRDELWHKGATSGNVMAVVDISVDCDEDTLLYSVHPTGPACHTGRHSCFDRPDTVPTQVSLSLETLERIIAERAGSASVDESYTARLLAGGPGKPAAKVVEEAGEVAVAALSERADALAGEAADLLYHLLVLLRSRGVPLSAVLQVLAERHAAPLP